MRFINRLPLNLKLTLTSLIPLFALIYFFFLVHADKKEQIIYTQNFHKRLNINLSLNNAVKELQQERRLSLRYYYDNESLQSLKEQQTKTNIAFEEVRTISKDNENSTFNYALGLEDWRDKIEGHQLPPALIVENYQMVVDRLRTLSYMQSDNPAVIKHTGDSLRAAFLLSDMINRIAIMRLEIYLANLNLEQLSTDYLRNFPTHFNLYRSFEQEFLRSGNEDLISQYESLADGPLSSTLVYMDSVARYGIQTPVDPDIWWDVSADALDTLRTHHTNLMADIQSVVASVSTRETANLRNVTIYLVLLTIIVLVILFWVTKSIVRQIRTLQVVAHEIAQGETDISLPIFPKDALGHLARSFVRIDRNNKKIVEAAKAIGNKNFDTPIALRGKNDELGASILQMRDALNTFETNSANEIWVQTGFSDINTVLLRKKKLEDTCKAVLERLVQYIEGDLGTFYVLNDQNKLELISTYAIYDLKQIPTIVQMGESRLGKVTAQKNPVLYTNVPEDYLIVGSSLGKKNATQLLILPLVQNEQIQGVIEIASLQNFHSAVTKLVRTISYNIATTIHSIKSRERLQELFEETQAQSEELQSQHGELESLNTELEAQAQKLQASEEELKVQQEELLQSNQELEERSNLLEDKNQIIIERNLEIQKKAEELALSTRYKSEFLANMSHELRTPLNSILLLSRLLSENTEQNLNNEQVEYAEVIQSSGQGLLTLIDEILDLSKIEAGKMSLEFKAESVQEIVSGMKTLFDPMGKEKNLKMNWIVADGVPEHFKTDRLRLEQILKNLLSNALKFTPKGFIELSVKQGEDNTLVFQVKDSGIGIASDKQEHIFGAFQQADGSTRRKFGGTGLGLSISRELSKLLKGTLTLTSEENKGSTFLLKIPANAENTEAADNPEQAISRTAESQLPSPAEQGEKEKNFGDEQRFLAKTIPIDVEDDRESLETGDQIILIIEDDTAFAKSLMKFAKRKGYKVIISVRGDQALDLAVHFRPVAILLDLQLPVKDGWQVMEELKNNINTRHIPVHMMSSYEIKKESIKKGAIDFINKPIAFEQMNSIFKKIGNALTKGTRKVLIVEENLKHAQALAYYLESFDVKAEIKKNLADSIEALSGNQIDCVILDMGVPDTTSYKTLETVKDNPGLENLPIIIFTGKNLSRIEEQKIKQYADSIVVKTAHSYERILDEVALFLHLVEEHNATNSKKEKNLLGPAFNEVLNGKTVLIADDDIRNIFSLTKVLENYQMHIVAANDGKEALEYLKANPDSVDIILMDMMMPEMDGYETTSQIRKNSQLRQIPILAVTAKAMLGDREKCIQAGASDYISKPIDMDQLISLLRVWLYNV